MFAVFLRQTARWLGYGLLGVVLLLALLIGWAGSPSALLWVANRVVDQSGERIQLQQVEGSLYGPLTIGTLMVHQNGLWVQIKNLTLDWRGRDLMWAHINVLALNAESVDIHLAETASTSPSREPLTLPHSLSLPFTFALRGQFAHVRLHQGDTTTRLQDINVEVARTADHYALTLQHLGTPWGAFSAEATLDERAPFRLTAQLKGQGLPALPYQLSSLIEGDLSQMAVQGEMQLHGSKAQWLAELTPFAAMPIRAATLSAQNINPQDFSASLPEANIVATIQLSPDKNPQAPHPSAPFHAKVQLRNDHAGTWDQKKLPLKQFNVDVLGTLAQYTLENIKVNLGQAGEWRGKGSGSQTAIQLALQTQDLNPQGLLRQAHALKLAGNLALSVNQAKQSLAVNLSARQYQLAINAHQQDGTVFLPKATLIAKSSKIRAQGKMALNSKQMFDLHSTLTAFNPADFGDFPRARINASMNLQGGLSPEADLQLDFRLHQSELRQQPLIGEGEVSASRTRLTKSHINLAWGRNRLTATGSFGALGDRLLLNLTAPQLALIHPDLSGTMNAEAQLQGTLTAPLGRFTLHAKQLKWQKRYQVLSLTASGTLAQDEASPLALDVAGKGLQTPYVSLDQITLALNGTRAKHTINLLARNAQMETKAHINAAWRNTGIWAGTLQTLTHQGRYPLTLIAPTDFEVGADHGVLNQTQLTFDTATLNLDHLTFKKTS